MLDSYWTSGIKATSEGSHVSECGWHCQTGDRSNCEREIT